MTSLGVEALHRSTVITRQADVIAALSIEALQGTPRAFDYGEDKEPLGGGGGGGVHVSHYFITHSADELHVGSKCSYHHFQTSNVTSRHQMSFPDIKCHFQTSNVISRHQMSFPDVHIVIPHQMLYFASLPRHPCQSPPPWSAGGSSQTQSSARLKHIPL